jgi:tRNA(Ile)-lysidine synthase
MPVPLTLMQRFERYVVSENLITQGMKLVIGVSGGADSIVLLYLLYHLRTNMHLSLVAVHINHNLRGAESDADEQFVKKLCSHLNIPTVVRSVTFESKADLENQARNKRKEILLQIMASYKFDKIALAHQKNDQAETVLMNLVRGSGITGLGGIKVLTDTIIRPLLTFSRAEIEEYLTANKYEWRYDKSNDETQFTRNRIRKELLPWIESNLNQSVVDRLALQANTFQMADNFLKTKTVKLLKKMTLEDIPEQIVLDLVLLKKLTEIEQFYILRSCYATLSKTDHEFFMHSFEEIRRLFNSDGSKQTRLAHNIWILKQYDELVITTLDPDAETTEVQELVIDDERTHFVFLNWRFTLKYLKNIPKNIDNTQFKHNILIDLNQVTLPFKLRTRQIGDRFIPTGMTSEKKLKEFFIDEKVPKLDRDKVPILTDAEKIIWIVGYRMDARAICHDDTHKILHITVEPVTTGRKRSANRAFNSKEGKNDIYEL